jgi:hypothetical protein
MALLTARSIQKLLDESSTFLTAKPGEDLARRLNLPNQALAAEWELIALSALSYVGVVEHEPRLSGATRLDVQFFQPGTGLKFIGDITTLSDDRVQKNSVDFLLQELPRYLDKKGIRGHLSVGIDCESGEHSSVLPRLPDPHIVKPYAFEVPAFRDFVASIRSDIAGTHHVRTTMIMQA